MKALLLALALAACDPTPEPKPLVEGPRHLVSDFVLVPDPTDEGFRDLTVQRFYDESTDTLCYVVRGFANPSISCMYNRHIEVRKP